MLFSFKPPVYGVASMLPNSSAPTTAHCAVKVRLFIDILSHIAATSYKHLSFREYFFEKRELPPPFLLHPDSKSGLIIALPDFNTNGHKRPRIAINIFTSHETQKAFTINSWIINGISCLENDIATQRLHRREYLSHTNLTLMKSTCYARAGGGVESLNSPYLYKSSHLRGGNVSSPRREALISAEGCTHLRGEKRISPHAQGRRIRNIHEDYIHYSQRINLLVSRRSHESHEKRIVTLAFAIRLQ